MSESLPDPGMPFLESDAAPARRRSWAWLAWIVIIGLCAFMVFGRRGAMDREGKGDLPEILMKIQGRYLVGFNDVVHQKAIYETSVKTLRQGGVDQRLRFVVLANELAGPKVALKELDLLDKDLANYQVGLTPDQARLRNILGRLVADYSQGRMTGPSLTAAQRELVRQRLDWFGELALAPSGADAVARSAALAAATRTFVIFFGGVLLGGLVGLAGFAGLIVFVAFVFTGKVKGIQTGTGRGDIYAETFAVWLILFLSISLVSSLLSLQSSPLLQGGFLLLSLFALGWPVLRGVPWSQVRADLGLNLGRYPLLEPIIGLGCYAMALPLVGIGLIVTLVLLQVQRNLSEGNGNPFTPTEVPSHPIVETIAHAGWPEFVGLIFLACLVAPIIEETMFRGVLYRHLREASARFGPILSFFASAVLVSFLFAVIHPQGIFAVPVLMALAFGFTMAREWRGSLLPAMAGHALNNGIALALAAVLLGD
jgi:membrane protease YdiL (CAAX protease family)